MNFDKIGPGDTVPERVNVIIEIPAKSEPVKYEVDKKTGALFVDRFLSTAMYYPCNYGYIPKTLSEDGDPVDVLVITPSPLINGAVICVRPIGMLKMTDEAGIDGKILAVPMDKLSTLYRHIHSPDDVAPELLETIAHFFEHYKDLEKGKWVKINGWVGPEETRMEITNSIKRFQDENSSK